MKKDINASLLPSLRQPLAELGQHLRLARQSRGWTIAEAAARSVVSQATYKRMEKGDPSVSFGAWAAALLQLQLLERVVSATVPTADAIGQALRASSGIKRVRKPKPAPNDKYDF